MHFFSQSQGNLNFTLHFFSLDSKTAIHNMAYKFFVPRKYFWNSFMRRPFSSIHFQYYIFWNSVRGHSTTTWTAFCHFLTPPLAWTVFIPWAWTKTDTFWAPPPSSCPRSYWMAPNKNDLFLAWRNFYRNMINETLSHKFHPYSILLVNREGWITHIGRYVLYFKFSRTLFWLDTDRNDLTH